MVMAYLRGQGDVAQLELTRELRKLQRSRSYEALAALLGGLAWPLPDSFTAAVPNIEAAETKAEVTTPRLPTIATTLPGPAGAVHLTVDPTVGPLFDVPPRDLPAHVVDVYLTRKVRNACLASWVGHVTMFDRRSPTT